MILIVPSPFGLLLVDLHNLADSGWSQPCAFVVMCDVDFLSNDLYSHAGTMKSIVYVLALYRCILQHYVPAHVLLQVAVAASCSRSSGNMHICDSRRWSTTVKHADRRPYSVPNNQEGPCATLFSIYPSSFDHKKSWVHLNVVLASLMRYLKHRQKHWHWSTLQSSSNTVWTLRSPIVATNASSATSP